VTRRLVALLRLPVDDYLAALDVFLRGISVPSGLAALLAALACWWIYLPVHELLHALGCVAGGGSVTRLEIDAIYGAAGRRHPGVGQAALFGAALPLALVPFGALAGDYYEMGSIIVSRLTALVVTDFPLERWRGDDLPLLIETLAGQGLSGLDVLGLSLSTLLGGALAFLTYAAGVAWSRLLETAPSATSASPR